MSRSGAHPEARRLGERVARARRLLGLEEEEAQLEAIRCLVGGRLRGGLEGAERPLAVALGLVLAVGAGCSVSTPPTGLAQPVPVELRADVPAGPVLLVDDLVVTGWTLTVAAVALREAGASAVLPVALGTQA